MVDQLKSWEKVLWKRKIDSNQTYLSQTKVHNSQFIIMFWVLSVYHKADTEEEKNTKDNNFKVFRFSTIFWDMKFSGFSVYHIAEHKKIRTWNLRNIWMVNHIFRKRKDQSYKNWENYHKKQRQIQFKYIYLKPQLTKEIWSEF